ncbi:phage terminase small subunit P27 family [soil metagenome]
MARYGPIPLPDNVRRLKGMRPLKGSDGKPARRVVLAPKAPGMPSGLGVLAAAEWRRVVRELERAGVLAEVDRGVLTAYCTAWQHMMEAEALLRRDKVVVEALGNSGAAMVKNPAWQIYREANRTMLIAAQQLYITPVSRLRIPIAPGAAGIGDADGDDAFD